MIVYAPISVGELVDKITILQLKMQNIIDESKLVNVKNELDELQKVLLTLEIIDITSQIESLYDTNSRLWEVEDKLRILELKKTFNQQFIELARSVYYLNDQRAAIKKQINVAVGSSLIEEKSYEQY